MTTGNATYDAVILGAQNYVADKAAELQSDFNSKYNAAQAVFDAQAAVQSAQQKTLADQSILVDQKATAVLGEVTAQNQASRDNVISGLNYKDANANAIPVATINLKKSSFPIIIMGGVACYYFFLRKGK